MKEKKNKRNRNCRNKMNIYILYFVEEHRLHYFKRTISKIKRKSIKIKKQSRNRFHKYIERNTHSVTSL